MEPARLLRGEYEDFEECQQRVRDSDPSSIAEELLALRTSLHALSTRNYYTISALKKAHRRVKRLERECQSNRLDVPGRISPPENAPKQELVIHYNVE